MRNLILVSSILLLAGCNEGSVGQKGASVDLKTPAQEMSNLSGAAKTLLAHEPGKGISLSQAVENFISASAPGEVRPFSNGLLTGEGGYPKKVRIGGQIAKQSYKSNPKRWSAMAWLRAHLEDPKLKLSEGDISKMLEHPKFGADAEILYLLGLSMKAKGDKDMANMILQKSADNGFAKALDKIESK